MHEKLASENKVLKVENNALSSQNNALSSQNIYLAQQLYAATFKIESLTSMALYSITSYINEGNAKALEQYKILGGEGEISVAATQVLAVQLQNFLKNDSQNPFSQKIFDRSISLGGNVNNASAKDNPLWNYAFEIEGNKRLTTYLRLLNDNGYNFNIVNTSGEDFLTNAVNRRDIGIIQACSKCNIKLPGETFSKKLQPIHRAVNTDNIELVRAVLSVGININAQTVVRQS